jgi:DTW domain-containing protein YfiP
MKYNFNFSCLTKHIFSGVAYMYVCILEHPHHFGKKSNTKQINK